MSTSANPIKWVKRAAKDIRVGDCTKWGYGHGTENLFRTVSRVELRGNGIVRIYHRETLPQFFDEYGENYQILVSSDPAYDVRSTRPPRT